MVSCISCFFLPWRQLTEAEQSICIPKGTPWRSEGTLQGTTRMVSPEKRSLSVNWSQTHFHHHFYLLLSPLHSIHISKETWECPTFTYFTCAALHWATVWLLAATVPHPYPVLSFNKDPDEISARSASTWKPQCEWVMYLFDNFPVILSKLQFYPIYNNIWHLFMCIYYISYAL